MTWLFEGILFICALVVSFAVANKQYFTSVNHQFIMSKCACSDENGRVDEILSTRVNIHKFEDFDKF